MDHTYTYPLRKIVISTWLREIMREKFRAEAELLVTPVDPDLFSRAEEALTDSLLRVLMLHHDYAWKGVVDGLEAVKKVKSRHPELCLVGFGVKRPRERLSYDEYYENRSEERRVGKECRL